MSKETCFYPLMFLSKKRRQGEERTKTQEMWGYEANVRPRAFRGSASALFLLPFANDVARLFHCVERLEI